ncbi:hypothetical protein MKW98_020153 [Papaver atlanticum]|uniref:Uncharacterized protein n=1 Tax=Papaver atlanticum TaxID=357466 RepID=A0AAD4SA73_9MAGN|nr:hypothetical protein MKW98_020153 [Papaver atlanticum]
MVKASYEADEASKYCILFLLVLKRDVQWESYMTCKMITLTCLDKIRRCTCYSICGSVKPAYILLRCVSVCCSKSFRGRLICNIIDADSYARCRRCSRNDGQKRSLQNLDSSDLIVD